MAKRKRITFTPEFKAEVVLETLSSESVLPSKISSRS